MKWIFYSYLYTCNIRCGAELSIHTQSSSGDNLANAAKITIVADRARLASVENNNTYGHVFIIVAAYSAYV